MRFAYRAALTALLWAALASTAHAAPGITYPDFSNNDPCVCGEALRTHGHVGEIDKANQGTRFIDSTFAPMIADAYRAGLYVGGYDFDQDYTVAEVNTFVRRLEAAGIHRGTRRTFPPTLDVEYGSSSRGGLERQVAVLLRVYGRAQIYTGGWYWYPHFGCWVPAHVSFWLAGYPAAGLLCGLGNVFYVAHQYTDHGATGAPQQPYADMSVWLGSTAALAAYVHAGATKAQLEAQLFHLYRERAGVLAKVTVLSALLTKHGCRPPHHAIPRSYHRRACPAWKAEGDASHRHIAALTSAINKQKERLR